MRNLAKKTLARTIGIAIFGCLGYLGVATCGSDKLSFSSISHAQDVEPGGKKGKGQPGAKGQKGMKGQPGFPGGGFPGMQGGIDPVKTQIKATDEEWKVIGPKLREVVAARRAAETGMGGDTPAMRGGFGGPGGGFGPPGGGDFGPPGGPGGPGGFGPPGGGGFAPPGGPGGFGPPGGGGFGPPGGPGGPGGNPGGRGAQVPAGPNALPTFLDVLKLTAEQKPQVETLTKELENKLAKVLTEEQNKRSKEMREGRGGFGVPPISGPILSADIIQKLNLTTEQKTQVESAQKDFDTKLAKLLTEEQNKQLTGIRDAIGRMAQGPPPSGIGPVGPPPFGAGGPPGFGGGNAGGDSAINQALNELQAAIDDPKTSPTQLNERVAAVRSARKKAREKLEVAKKELLLLITSDQEAVLVRLGYLD